MHRLWNLFATFNQSKRGKLIRSQRHICQEKSRGAALVLATLLQEYESKGDSGLQKRSLKLKDSAGVGPLNSYPSTHSVLMSKKSTSAPRSSISLLIDRSGRDGWEGWVDTYASAILILARVPWSTDGVNIAKGEAQCHYLWSCKEYFFIFGIF